MILILYFFFTNMISLKLRCTIRSTRPNSVNVSFGFLLWKNWFDSLVVDQKMSNRCFSPSDLNYQYLIFIFVNLYIHFRQWVAFLFFNLNLKYLLLPEQGIKSWNGNLIRSTIKFRLIHWKEKFVHMVKSNSRIVLYFSFSKSWT